MRWQTSYSLKMKPIGPYAIVAGQKYVSEVRAMCRILRAGGRPESCKFRPLRCCYPGHFLQQRLNERLRRAIDRGETSQAIARRGVLGAVGRHRN